MTYQGFAAAWPSMSDEQGFAARMNALPKYVASTTLDGATWNATLIKDDVPAEVARLKEQAGGDLLVYGSARLVGTLMERGLVDEYRLMLHPVVLGRGKRLFQDGMQATLRLLDGRTTSTGVALLTYEPARGT